ncbi:MAG TPA: hypothetical protein VF614_14020, partial [Chthoniobacteraceae bacterium]
MSNEEEPRHDLPFLVTRYHMEAVAVIPLVRFPPAALDLLPRLTRRSLVGECESREDQEGNQ